MPLPPSLATKTLHGKYTTADGNPAIGAVTFTTSPYTLRAQADDTIIPVSDRVAVLDGSGEFTLTNLASTNDPDVAPVGWVWTVTEVIVGSPQRVYQISIPYDAASTLQLADLVPAVPAPAMGDYVTQGDLQAVVDAAMASSTELADAIADALLTAVLSGDQITSGTVADARIASTIARDSEVTAAIAALSTVYQALSGKNAASGYAGLDASTKLLVAQIPDLSATYQLLSGRNAASGYAGLDASSLLSASQLPNHSGALITSGTVAEARIDALIARLTQVVQTSGTQTGLAGAKTWTGLHNFNGGAAVTGGFSADTIAAGTVTSLAGTFQGSYSAYSGSTDYVPRFYVTQGTAGNEVAMRGRIVAPNPGSYGDQVLTGLPAAACPTREVEFTVATDNSNPGSIRITPAGTIFNMSGNIKNYISLDNVRYYKGAN